MTQGVSQQAEKAVGKIAQKSKERKERKQQERFMKSLDYNSD